MSEKECELWGRHEGKVKKAKDDAGKEMYVCKKHHGEFPVEYVGEK